mgnify:CR=1 FL=1
MATEYDPIVGNWYQHLDKGQKFEVVAVDEDAGLVELQHFDGDVEETDLEGWYEMEIEPIEAPEDWTGPVDEMEPDQLGYTETAMDKEDWSSGYDEYGRTARQEEDEWGEGRPEEEPWQGEE